MTTNTKAEYLTELGYTALEADVYLLLLQQSPLTGYRIASELGKAAANTYKALESLEAKGAVTLDDSDNRLYSPVPVDEFLRQFDRRCAKRRILAEEALSGFEPAGRDDRIYRLRNRAQIAERCRSILERAEFAVLIDGDGGFLTDLVPDIEALARRGVQVVLKAYRPVDIAGARIVERIRPEEITTGVPGDFFVLNADGKEYLLVRVRDDGKVHHAIWTQAPSIAFQGYTGLINEFSLTAIMKLLYTDTSIEALREVFERDRPLHPVSSRNPVFTNLLEGLGYTTSSGTSDERDAS